MDFFITTEEFERELKTFLDQPIDNGWFKWKEAVF